MHFTFGASHLPAQSKVLMLNNCTFNWFFVVHLLCNRMYDCSAVITWILATSSETKYLIHMILIDFTLVLYSLNFERFYSLLYSRLKWIPKMLVNL